MTIEGGLRDRLVFESFADMVYSALSELNWFDTGRAHAPIIWRTTAVPVDQEIPVNTVVVSFEDASGDQVELGSGLTEDETTAWIDVYAESDPLGRHLAGDIRDILRGKMPSINRDDPTFWVVDMRMPAPTLLDPTPRTPLFLVDIDEVQVERSHAPSSQRNWFAVTCTLVEVRP